MVDVDKLNASQYVKINVREKIIRSQKRTIQEGR